MDDAYLARRLNRLESIAANTLALLSDMREQFFDAADNESKALQELRSQMALNFDNITAQIDANTSAVDSASTLLDELAAELRNIDTSDPAAQAQLDQFAAELQANSSRLAEAVVRNTPADTGGGTTPTEPPAPSETGPATV